MTSGCRPVRLCPSDLQIGSGLLTTAVGLVTPSLVVAHPSHILPIKYPPSMDFTHAPVCDRLPISNRDVETQLTHTPVIVSTCSSDDSASPQEVYLINQLRFSVPRLLQPMNMAENLRFDSARFRFSDKRADAVVHPHGEFGLYPPNCPLLAPRLASIFYGTNFRFSKPNLLCGGAPHS